MEWMFGIMWACIRFYIHSNSKCKVVKMTNQQQELLHDITYDIMIWEMILEGLGVLCNHL